MIGIQKQILLLSDFHFKEFANYLLEVNAELPYKLITTIRQAKTPHESDELCRLTYGDSEEKTKKKFLQLTHHTFKLSVFLSRNYPNYLKHNLQQIEILLSKGEKEEANILADSLSDIAEKIEDFNTLIELYKFLAQQCFITESREAHKLHQKIDEFISLEQIKNSIYLHMREKLFYKSKEGVSKTQAVKNIAFYNQYINHQCQSISILARYGKYHELSFLSHPDFFKPETLKEIDVLERDFLNNAYVIFHFLDDLYYKILGLRLQLDVSNNDTNQMLQEIKKMNEISSFLKYWKSYINIPEIFSFSVQVSYYMNTYGYTFRDDYHQFLPSDVSVNMNLLRQRIEKELTKEIYKDSKYIIKLINLKNYYAVILLTGDTSDRIKSTKILEDMLITYQQIPFQKYLDGIFITLIIGYFSLKDYNKVVATYKRYKKITTEQIVVKENDICIDVFYYTTQYITTQRKQYLEKLKLTYERARDFNHVCLLIKELRDYFVLPVNF